MIEEVVKRQAEALSKLQIAFQKAQQDAQSKALAEQQEKVQKFLLDVYTKTFEKAQAYVNVIILAGYAGAFAIWSATRAALPLKTNIVIALRDYPLDARMNLGHIHGHRRWPSWNPASAIAPRKPDRKKAAFRLIPFASSLPSSRLTTLA